MGTKPSGKRSLTRVEPRTAEKSWSRNPPHRGAHGTRHVSATRELLSPQEELLVEISDALDAGAYALAHRALFSVLAPRRRDARVQSNEIFERWWSSDGPDRPIALFSSSGDADLVRFVLVAQRSAGGLLYEVAWEDGGWRPSGTPKRWSVAAPGSEGVYRCERRGAGYVVKRRDGESGPSDSSRTLGALLEGRLPLPASEQTSGHRVSLAPSWSWEARLETWAVAFVQEALNGEVGE